MISDAEVCDNDQSKKNFLLEKLMQNGKELIIHHKIFDECIESLMGAYGYPIKITNERITAFFKCAQEPVKAISNPDKISGDLAKQWGLEARLVQPRDNSF